MLDSVLQNCFSLRSTRFFLLLLVFLYFFFPSVLSQYLFDNSFYIYSEDQKSGNVISIIAWLVLSIWVYFAFKGCYKKEKNLVCRMRSTWLFKSSYYIFIYYLLALVAFGLLLHMQGASREELLDGIDKLLLPGLSYLLINCAIFIITQERRSYFYFFIILCFIVDALFDGKIFSFLAFVIIFFRIDFFSTSNKNSRKKIAAILLFGSCMVTFIGFSRAYLAEGDFKANSLQIIYTICSEFLGVQASTGWAVKYFENHDPMVLFSYGSALQDTYISSVGHGLAISTPAYFVGNFGAWAFFAALIAFVCLYLLFFIYKSKLSWIVPLVIALNFQHLMRHGFDIFIAKVFFQLLYSAILELLFFVSVRKKEDAEFWELPHC